MLGVVIISIVACTAVWVYLDATKNKIGKIEGAGGMFNMSAGGWSIVTLLLWVIGFPAYLVNRGLLIEKAKGTPVEVQGRGGKAVVLGAVGALWIFLSLTAFMSGDVPACDSPEVTDLAMQAIKDAPVVKLSGLEVKNLSIPAEVNYNASTETRLCRAQLAHALGNEIIQYSVQWHDKANQIIYVEIVGD